MMCADLGAPLGEAIDVECGVRGMCSLAMGGPRTDQVLAGSSDASLFAMEVPPNAGGEAEPEKLGDFHLGRVTAAVPLSDTEHFATCGEDGTLRLWSSKTGGCGIQCPNCLVPFCSRLPECSPNQTPPPLSSPQARCKASVWHRPELSCLQRELCMYRHGIRERHRQVRNHC